MQKINRLGPAPVLPGRDAHPGAEQLVKALEKQAPDTRRVFERQGNESKTSEITNVVLRSTPIVWAIPLDEVLFTRFFTNFINLRAMPWDNFFTSTNTYITEARNTLHENFVDHHAAEWMLMLDSDVLPPPDVVQRLLAHNLPMVGGWYRKKAEPYQPCVYDFVSQDGRGIDWWRERLKPGEGVEQVDGAGAGCWLMNYETAKALGRRPYDPHVLSEDFVLCRKLKELGIPMHIDWSIACAHVGVAYT